MTLAQAGSAGGASSWPDALLWLTILLLALVGLAVVVAVIRKRTLGSGAGEEEAFTLDQIERMRRRGDLTEEEYRAARKVLIDAVTAGKGSNSA